MALLARYSNTSWPWLSVTCSFRMVASPEVPFSSAYSSPPGRKKPRSIRRIAAARTRSLVRPAAVQVTADHLADPRQGSPELPDPVVLVLVPLLTPQIVIPVLAASRRVGADGLDVALGIDADPHVLRGRRDHQGPDPGERPGVLDHRRVRTQIAETATAAPAPDPRAAGVASAERGAGRAR